jgi:hypothetical protein
MCSLVVPSSRLTHSQERAIRILVPSSNISLSRLLDQPNIRYRASESYEFANNGRDTLWITLRDSITPRRAYTGY